MLICVISFMAKKNVNQRDLCAVPLYTYLLAQKGANTISALVFPMFRFAYSTINTTSGLVYPMFRSVNATINIRCVFVFPVFRSVNAIID